MHRLDVVRCVDIVAQRLTDLANAGPERPLAHHPIGPDGAQEFFLGDQPARMLHEVTQNGEGFGCELPVLLSMPNLLVLQIEEEWTRKEVFY
jgi:hypothetical protein